MPTLPTSTGRRTIEAMTLPARKITTRATVADLLAIPEEKRFHELIAGEIVPKAQPSWSHGRAQARAVTRISDPYDRPPGRRGPGGWWIVTEVEVALSSGDVYRPDIVGWRRERLPKPPTEFPVDTQPDWVCEVLSPSRPGQDTVTKLQTYHRCQIPHYWLLDPMRETLTVLRYTPAGYLVALAAARGALIRAEPFEEVEMDVGDLFGDEEEAASEG